MKINKKFKNLSYKELKAIIPEHKKYTDFNTLGLYRGILESEKLTLAQKVEMRDFAHEYFGKTFNFLQLKDPFTYFNLTILAQEEEMTVADKAKVWEDIRHNQEKILKEKRIKHRNFGSYSKHDCGYDACPYQGVMFKQGSQFLESHMFFKSDR